MSKILIIDDEPNIRLITRLMLEKKGYEVIEAEDGETGLAVLEREEPDLIILDVMMPGMKGWDVCHKIKGDSSLKAIPVLMFTVRTSDVDKTMARECGAEAYLSKPFNVADLLATVEDLLG